MKRSFMIRRAVAITLTVAVLLCALSVISKSVELKISAQKHEDFFNEKNDFDILFLGTSHMLNAVFPMELWNSYGMTSYNLGGHSTALATSYWIMELALDYTKPSLIVIDCLGLDGMTKTSTTSFSYVHLSLDAFPLSRTKIRAVYDLLDDKEIDRLIAAGDLTESEKRTPIGLLWNFSVYHGRWDSLGKSDLFPEKNIEKGAEHRVRIGRPNPILDLPKEEMMTDDTVSLQYLERMITECRERGIDVLLTYLPFPATEEQHREANRVYETARKYGVGYLNFLDLSVIDYDVDCSDPGSHLNPSGARKITDYLGNYISEQYHIRDKRSEAAFSRWNDDYRIYQKYKYDLLRQTNDLDIYLMLIADQNLMSVIEINNPQLFEDEHYSALAQNLGISPGNTASDLLIVDGKGSEVKCLKKDSTGADSVSADAGHVTLTGNASDSYMVFLDQQELYTVSGQSAADIRICAVDKATGEVVDTVNSVFSYDPAGHIVSPTVAHER